MDGKDQKKKIESEIASKGMGVPGEVYFEEEENGNEDWQK